MYGLNSDFMKRDVVIYGRVSTEHEAQLSALENQIDWYKPILAQRPEWNLVNTYVDEGITGTSAEKRPQFIKMINDAKKRKFNMIITREVSRFARNTVDTLQYTRLLKSYGVEVFFINDNIKTFDGDGELRLTIMATLAQDESRKTSIRVKSGQQTSMNNGVFYGTGNILGYDRVGKDMVINPEQAKTVRMIFDMYLSGMGMTKIKYELEKAHRLTSQGLSNWYTSVIAKILKNTFYCGIITYHKQYTPDYLTQIKVHNHGEIPLTRTKGRHQPIVTEEEFQTVQKILDSKRTAMTNSSYGHIGKYESKVVWSRLLVCECGNKFGRRKWDRKDGNINFGYICYTSANHGSVQSHKNRKLPTEKLCNIPMIPEWKLYMAAKHIFEMYISKPDEVLNFANDLIQAHLSDTKEVVDNSELITTQKDYLDKLNKKLDGLIEMRSMGDISREVFKEKTSDVETQIFAAKKQIELLEEEQVSNEHQINYVERFEAMKKVLRSYTNVQEGDIPDNIIEAIIKKVVVKKSEYDFYLRVSLDNKTECFDENPQMIASFKLTIHDAKKYIYSKSTSKRVYNWKDIKVNIWF